MSNKFHIGHFGYAPGGILCPGVDPSLFWVILDDARIDIEGLRVMADGFLIDDKLEQLQEMAKVEYLPFLYSIFQNGRYASRGGKVAFGGRIDVIKSKKADMGGVPCLNVCLLIEARLEAPRKDVSALVEGVNNA